MNEIIIGAIAPIILYGDPQGVWTPIPNNIGIPTQAPSVDVYYGDSFQPDTQFTPDN